MADLSALHEAVVEGDAKQARALTDAALTAGVAPQDILATALIPAMDVVGQRFECGDYFVPELLVSARAMKTAMEPLRPLLAAAGAQPIAKVAIGAVKGDLHDIGKKSGGGYAGRRRLRGARSRRRCAG
jgi:methanogenic corrinoid protein MtbC1